MHSYGLVIPGSEASRLHLFTSTSASTSSTSTSSKISRPDPILRLKPLTRFASLQTKATINDRVAADLSFYELLGIPETGTLPEIKHAYKQLARKYHPDVSPPDRVEEYTQRFIRVQEAYETLSDPGRRALYDRDLAWGLHLAFSARRRFQYQNDLDMDDRNEWKIRWQAQLSGLKKRGLNKDARGNMSWGARMRRQREELSHEL